MESLKYKIGNDIAAVNALPEFSFEALEVYKNTLDVSKAIQEGHRLADIQRRKAEYEAKRKAEEEARKEAEAKAAAQRAAAKKAKAEEIATHITPPELVGDISENGIVLTGGTALLYGMKRFLESETGIEVFLADDPIYSCVSGAATIVRDMDFLTENGYSFKTVQQLS